MKQKRINQKIFLIVMALGIILSMLGCGNTPTDETEAERPTIQATVVAVHTIRSVDVSSWVIIYEDADGTRYYEYAVSNQEFTRDPLIVGDVVEIKIFTVNGIRYGWHYN